MIARSQGDVDLLEFLTWVQHMAATPTGVSASMVWFYKEQAAQGNSAAILNLAICNLSGVGMLQNAEEGVRLLKDAAGRGNAMAVRGGGSTQSHTRTRADLLCSASPDTARRECRRLCLTRLVSGCTHSLLLLLLWAGALSRPVPLAGGRYACGLGRGKGMAC
jgi:hypothetical protein